MTNVTPFLWFNDQAGEALHHYTATFANSEVLNIASMGDDSLPDGGVISATIRLGDQTLILFNGGPHFSFNEAVSLFVSCEGQEEVDHYWSALGDGGTPGRCGWLKDRYGVSWQIVPTLLVELLGDPDPERSQRVREAMLSMGKLDCAALLSAHQG